MRSGTATRNSAQWPKPTARAESRTGSNGTRRKSGAYSFVSALAQAPAASGFASGGSISKGANQAPLSPICAFANTPGSLRGGAPHQPWPDAGEDAAKQQDLRRQARICFTVFDQNHWPGSIRPRSINCWLCHSKGVELCQRKFWISKREPGFDRRAFAVRNEQIAAVMLLCQGQA
jgi:hypothetical protein